MFLVAGKYMANESLLAGFMKNKKDAGDTLKRLDAVKEFRIEFIQIEKIRKNPKNDYPVDSESEFIESLKRSIMSPTGMINNLDVYQIEEDADGHQYELIAGESRLTAIQQLREEGKDIFKNGIPCKVYPSDMNEVDRQIALIEANEITREFSSERRRKKLKELEELYKRKGKKDSDITKEISSTAGIGIRQVQRYRAVNESLIPELITELDNANISLESAAKLSRLTEDMQLLVAEFIKTGQVKGNEEISQLQKMLKDKEEQKKLLEEKIKKADEGVERKQKDLEQKEREIKKREEEIEQIKNDLAEQEMNDQERAEYERKLKKAEEERENEKLIYEKKKKEVEKENELLREELERYKQNEESGEEKSKGIVSDEEKEKIKFDYQISLIASDIVKISKKLRNEIEKYQERYGVKPENYERILSDVQKILK